MKADNWVVLLCSSRYFHNYRHLSNALSIYAIVKQLGIRDDHIIFLNSLDAANDDRNALQGEIYNNIDFVGFDENNLFNDVDFDYIGDEVTVNSFINLLTDRHHYSTSDQHEDIYMPKSKRLLTNENSKILIFISGHGGNEFFKFQDQEELSAEDLGHMFKLMYTQKRYNEILLLIDTCQASTLTEYIDSPNIITISSSSKGQNSYSYLSSELLGVSLIDRFSYSIYTYFQSILTTPSTPTHTHTHTHAILSPIYTLQSLINALPYSFLRSTVTVSRSTPGTRKPADIPLTDFFGGGGEMSGQQESSSDSSSGVTWTSVLVDV